jgi:hypothetical protein
VVQRPPVNTEPLLRLNIEAATAPMLERKKALVFETLKIRSRAGDLGTIPPSLRFCLFRSNSSWSYGGRVRFEIGD